VGSKLAKTKSVVRYVGGAHLDPNTRMIGGSAFDRGPKDTDGLSFTQCGILAKQQAKDDNEIRRIIGSRIALGKTACFAELNVGEAIDALSNFERAFWFQLDPVPKDGEQLENPAQTLLIGLPFKGEAVGSLNSELAGDLLRRCIRRTFPAIAEMASE
jgi:hypothetical protein